MSQHSNYRPDIDGLRAVAVLAVVFFHMGGLPVSGGFVGVDVFFVISGYLISGNIMKSMGQGRFSLLEFFERRFRRLQPALIGVMLASVVAFSIVLTPIDYKAFAQSVGSSLLFCSNVLFYLKSGYFDPSSETKPLLHTWSLGVEEQFYFVFPLLMLLVYGWGRKWMAVAFGLLALTSLTWSAFGSEKYPEAVFYLPFSRMWELLLGVLLVLLKDRLPSGRWIREVMAATGLMLVLSSILMFTPKQGYPGWEAVVPCFGAVLIIASAERGIGYVSGLLAWRPMVFIGTLSYSMYLWHWPLLVFIKYLLFRDLDQIEIVLYLLALLGVSWLSWRWIETPVRGGLGHAPWSQRAVFVLAGTSISLAGAFALYGHFSGGAPSRWSTESQSLAAAVMDTNPRREQCDRRSPEDVRAGRLCVIGADDSQPTNFAVVGDSFGDAMIPGFDAAARESGRRGVVLTHSGCFPLIGVRQDNEKCHLFTQALQTYFQDHPEIRHVFLVSRWTSAVLGNRFGQIKGDEIFITDEYSLSPSYEENRRVFDRSLLRTLNILEGRRVSIVAFIPEQRYDIPRALSLSRQLNVDMNVDLPLAEHMARQFDVRQAFLRAGIPNQRVDVIDVGEKLCDSTHCKVEMEGTILYADDNHLSRSGSIYIRQVLNSALQGK